MASHEALPVAQRREVRQPHGAELAVAGLAPGFARLAQLGHHPFALPTRLGGSLTSGIASKDQRLRLDLDPW